MWSGSNTNWGHERRDMDHLIKYAESMDGLNWRRDGRVVIPPKSPEEYAISKPCVLSDPGTYRMWYSYRGSHYQIGYAESKDALSWTRLDDAAGIDRSAEGWDSEAICYACVFDQAGSRFMLFNGNGYGRTGFGIAVLEHD